MAEETIIVSACGREEYPYLCDLQASIVGSGAAGIADFGVVDLGLSDNQRQQLVENKIWVMDPVLLAEAHSQEMSVSSKSQLVRTRLPELFPQYQYIFWIDSDSWLQDASVLHLFLEGARIDGFCVVPLLDRAYSTGAIRTQKEFLEMGFGEGADKRFGNHPAISPAAFCGAVSAPHWGVWRDYTLTALRRHQFREAEQTALSVLVHEGKLPVHMLPSFCNWACNSRSPIYDPGAKRFVEPYVPHTPIGIMGHASRSGTNPVLMEYRGGTIQPRSMGYREHRHDIADSLDLSQVPGTRIEKSIAGLTVSGAFKPAYLDKLFERVSANSDVYFVQIGAMDGVSHDPIHDAVRTYGWCGVLVEPLPDMFELLRVNYSGCEGLDFEMAAITENCSPMKMYRVPVDAVQTGQVPVWALGISSLYKDRNAIGGKRISNEDYERIRECIIEEAVEGITFDELVRRQKIGSIDVLQIDAEGGDYSILCQIDFERFHPKVIQLEFCNIPDQEKADCLSLLKAQEYICYISINGTDLLAVAESLAD